MKTVMIVLQNLQIQIVQSPNGTVGHNLCSPGVVVTSDGIET
jgi:hypothetical protein